NILKLRSKCMCFPLRTVAFRGHFPKDMPFNYRKWNILAFRGRLMSLLAPARGMSTLPAKGGFSRPSSFTHSGVSPRPHLPQESRIFHLLGQIIIIVYSVFLYSSQFHKRFNLFII